MNSEVRHFHSLVTPAADFLCMQWLAQYRIAHATSLDELRQVLPLLEWTHSRVLRSGVMAEQVHPFTNEPLSVSPLTWSHAEYVLTVRWYLGKYHRFMEQAKKRARMLL